MATKEAFDIELPPELIQQYKEALAALSDIRLITLLLFNSFEEIMKSFAAWRMSCHVDELPSFLTNNPSFLFEIVLIGRSAKKLRSRVGKLRELRNMVAHKFHRNEYKSKLENFVKEILDKPCLASELAKRKALVEAVFSLALDIAEYVDNTAQRGNWPFPFLTLELSVSDGKSSAG